MFKKLWNALKSLKKKEGGFTLIELAVILAVIGILAGVGVMKYVDVTDGAYRTNAQTRLADIKSCISMTMAKHGGRASKANLSVVLTEAYGSDVSLSATDLTLTFPAKIQYKNAGALANVVFTLTGTDSDITGATITTPTTFNP